jgi:hypothetical protein
LRFDFHYSSSLPSLFLPILFFTFSNNQIKGYPSDTGPAAGTRKMAGLYGGFCFFFFGYFFLLFLFLFLFPRKLRFISGGGGHAGCGEFNVNHTCLPYGDFMHPSSFGTLFFFFFVLFCLSFSHVAGSGGGSTQVIGSGGGGGGAIHIIADTFNNSGVISVRGQDGATDSKGGSSGGGAGGSVSLSHSPSHTHSIVSV